VANIIQKDLTHFEVFFEGVPDWVIPMIKVIPQFYTDNIYDWSDLTLVYDFNYFWEKVNDKNYRLYLRISGQLQDSEFHILPLYADISCWILNSNFRNNIQHNLGY
jgi:hypothetical protein